MIWWVNPLRSTLDTLLQPLTLLSPSVKGFLSANESVSYASDLVGHSVLLSTCEQSENLTVCMLRVTASYESPTLIFGDHNGRSALLTLREQFDSSTLCFTRVVAFYDTLLLAFGEARFGRPFLFFVDTIPMHLRWITLAYLDYQGSSIAQARNTALECMRGCLTRSRYLSLRLGYTSSFAVVRPTWYQLFSFLSKSVVSVSYDVHCWLLPRKKHPVPSFLQKRQLKPRPVQRPVGGRAQRTQTYEELKEYIVLSALDDASLFDYKFSDVVPYEDIHKFSTFNNLVLVQLPMDRLLSYISLANAKRVLRIHGVQHWLKKYDSHNSPEILSAARSHSCGVCNSHVCVFLTVASSSNRRKAQNHAYYKSKTRKKVSRGSEGVSDRPSGATFPPPPLSGDLSCRVIRDFCYETSPAKFEEEGCAVCGVLTPVSSLKPLQSLRNQLHVLEATGVTRSLRRSCSDPVVEIEGPVLASGCDKICDACSVCVRKNTVPRNALASGLWVGDVPSELSDLRFVERLLIARVRHNVCFVKVASGQRKLISHVVVFESPVQKIYTKLPPPREDLDEVLAILFTGPVRPMKEHYLRTPLLVRHKAVVRALEWLKLNHVDYSDLEIDYDGLRRDYPEDTPCVSVQYQESLCNKRPESTSVHDTTEEEGTEEGECPFVVHGVTSMDVETKTTEQLKGIALRHFNSNGRVLAVDGSAKTESIYRNPQLYPQMFPWLFPYGYGGVGTVPKLSEDAHKRHLLLYHDKRFQTDVCFPLVCFSHKLIKASTTGGFLLAEKSKFDDIVDRLTSVDKDVLKSLADRLAAGDHVRPETDAEKMCYQIIKDLDQINFRVDNSTTSKKTMRNEIWSLIAHLGLPTWFITFTPADSYHPICLYFADKNVKFSPSFRKMDDRIRLIAKNPVAGARFFHFMVKCFIKHVLGVDTDHPGIFGETSGYYGTVEQQGRLTLHLHLLLWIANALSPEEIKRRLMDPDGDFQTEIILYLESVHVGEFLTGTKDEILAEIDKEQKEGTFSDPSQSLPVPPPLMCPNACDSSSCVGCTEVRTWRQFFCKQVDYLLTQTNIHVCRSNLDSQGKQQKNRTWLGCINNKWQRCKARFPRLVVIKSFVDEDGHLHLKKLEPWINTISPVVTYLLRCNTDVTSLRSGTAAKAAIHYLTNYVTKASLKTSVVFDIIRKQCLLNPVILSDDPNRREKARSLMTKIVNNLSAKMEIGAPLACLYLLGYPDHYVSHRFTPFYWQSFVHEVRAHWNAEVSSKIIPKVTIVKSRGRVIGLSPVYDYIYRPQELQNVSLYDWISRCKREPLKKKSKSQSVDNADSYVQPEEDTINLDPYDDAAPVELDVEDGVSSPTDSREISVIPVGVYKFLPDHPLYDTHAIRVVAPQFGLIPNFAGATLPRRDGGDREYYCSTMLAFFKPWRSGASLKTQNQSWDEAFSDYNFSERHVQIMNNTHLRFECIDAQDDYHALLRTGNVSLPSGVRFDKDVVVEAGLQDDLDDLNAEALLQAESRVIGQRQKNRNKQMGVVRGILDRLGWCSPLELTSSLSFVGVVSSCLSSQQWSLLIQNSRQSLLQQREMSPDPVQRTESFTGKDASCITDASVYTASKAYLERKYHSKKDMETVTCISRLYSLNEEQDRAFRIIANHICNPYSEQLKMYLGGMGGTGKSRVLLAVLAFFRHRNELHRCVVVAPTGSAAALLQGSTYHYMFGIDDKKDDISVGRLGKVATRLQKVDYVFMDEVSMLSCRDMHVIGSRLCKVKNNLAMPFGGMNMIFAGDFAQLPPPYGGENASLYSVSVGRDPSRFNSQIAALGKALWHQITTVVILRQNMRVKSQTADDARFREALSNMRYKNCTMKDITFLRTLVSSDDPARCSVSHPNFRNVSIITSQNIHKDEINRLGSNRFAVETNQELRHFYSEDVLSSFVPAEPESRYKRRRVKNQLPSSVQHALWNQPASANTSRIAGRLSLCRGLPVMIRSNIATELCITKGQEGTVHSWDESIGVHGKPILNTLFVTLVNPPSDVHLPGLPLNVVPIPRSTVAITCDLPDDSSISVSRTQVEVLPNFAMTDYASQGKTRQFNVCDLNNSRSHQAYYTALSRSSSAKGTVILQGFDRSKITGGCSGALRQEYRELELLDDITASRYVSELPDTVYGDRRNTLIESFRCALGKGYKPIHLHPSLVWTDDAPFTYTSDVPYSWNHEFDRVVAPGSSTDHVSHSAPTAVEKRKEPPSGSDELQASSVRRSPSPVRTFTFKPCGPTWVNNSCAYDALTTTLFNLWQERPVYWHRAFCSSSSGMLTTLSNIMLRQPLTPGLADQVRDKLRLLMYGIDNDTYRAGRYISVTDLASHTFSIDGTVCTGITQCSNAHISSCQRGAAEVTSYFIDVPVEHNVRSVRDWLLHPESTSQRLCIQCQEPLTTRYSFHMSPPLLGLDVWSRGTMELSRNVTINVASQPSPVKYRLSSVIYFGQGHFTTRYLSPSGSVFYHDGINGSDMVVDSAEHINLRSCRGKSASFVLYVVDNA